MFIEHHLIVKSNHFFIFEEFYNVAELLNLNYCLDEFFLEVFFEAMEP